MSPVESRDPVADDDDSGDVVKVQAMEPLARRYHYTPLPSSLHKCPTDSIWRRHDDDKNPPPNLEVAIGCDPQSKVQFRSVVAEDGCRANGCRGNGPAGKDVVARSRSLQDADSGYYSDGGMQYARRLQQRLHDGLKTVRECVESGSLLSENAIERQSVTTATPDDVPASSSRSRGQAAMLRRQHSAGTGTVSQRAGTGLRGTDSEAAIDSETNPFVFDDGGAGNVAAFRRDGSGGGSRVTLPRIGKSRTRDGDPGLPTEKPGSFGQDEEDAESAGKDEENISKNRQNEPASTNADDYVGSKMSINVLGPAHVGVGFLGSVLVGGSRSEGPSREMSRAEEVHATDINSSDSKGTPGGGNLNLNVRVLKNPGGLTLRLPNPGVLNPGVQNVEAPSPGVLTSPKVPVQGYPDLGVPGPVLPNPRFPIPGFPKLGVPNPGMPSPGVLSRLQYYGSLPHSARAGGDRGGRRSDRLSFVKVSSSQREADVESNSSGCSTAGCLPPPLIDWKGGMTSTGSFSLPTTPRRSFSRNDDSDIHASMLSLISSGSSVYSTTAEEKQIQEIHKLKTELEAAHERINTLTVQLNANVHVVTAFEKSLSNMTERLQKLTNSSEQKDLELSELKLTLRLLQQQQQGADADAKADELFLTSNRQSTVMLSSVSQNTAVDNLTGLTPLRSSSDSSQPSFSSIQTSSVVCPETPTSLEKKQKKKGWLNLSSSLQKAFSRKRSKESSEADLTFASVVEAASSTPNSPLLRTPYLRSVPSTPLTSTRRAVEPFSPLVQHRRDLEFRESETILQLKQQLHEKDMKLTDIRLEALTSAHQLEQLHEVMNQMKTEMASLKAENERMALLVAQNGLTDSHQNKNGSSASLSSSSLIKKPLTLGEPSNFDSLSMESITKDMNPRYTVAVQLGPWTDQTTLPTSSNLNIKRSQVLIGTVGLTSTTKWETLDSTVRRIFKEHVNRLDPGTGLGLNGDSVLCYHIGEITRSKGFKMPELLPCGYLVGHDTTIIISLKGVHDRSVDALAFETLVAKSLVQRYVTLLVEQRRLILCGPSGTRKTFLAEKLAEYLVFLSGKELQEGAVTTFSVDSKSSRELGQYLSNVADQSKRRNSGDRTTATTTTTITNDWNCVQRPLPVVIIIDNLHHVVSFEDTFNAFLNFNYKDCPYIIGTMNQSASSSTGPNLHLHHNFRWVLCRNHSEPVRNFLSRFLQRRLVEQEIVSNSKNSALCRIVDWLPNVWLYLNKFLEIHSSSDAVLGPRLFMAFPMDLQSSLEWFTDLWNYSIVPYLLEATRDNAQQGPGKNDPWQDPTDWILESFPFPNAGGADGGRDRLSLLHVRPSSDGNGLTTIDENSPLPLFFRTDYGQTDSSVERISDRDPLKTMLEQLKETSAGMESKNASHDLDLHSDLDLYSDLDIHNRSY